ncbi:MAG: hypothetical protein FJW30_10105 [Acidobacteria bacterium]|nr:hypothetical protein [Acidobacteriota bacterium]
MGAESKDVSYPFGIKESDLGKVEISLRVSTTRMASGYDAICVRGRGEVELRSALRADDEPAMVTRPIPLRIVERLLLFLGSEGMETWDEEYPPETHEYAGQLIQVTVDGEVRKQISMCRTAFAEYSHAFGALKFTAALAAPEVVSGGFFKRI